MSSGWSNAFDGDEDREEENDDLDGKEEAKEGKNRDALVFLVDCNPTMAIKDKKGGAFLEHVIQLISNVIKNRIISAATDYLGVCFFNSKKKDNSNGFAGVNVFHKLDLPDAQFIKKIDSLLDAEEFKTQVGSVDESKCEFVHALWTTSEMFNEVELKKASKRVIIFTNNDDPTNGNPDVRAKIVQRVKDMEELNITLQCLPTDRPESAPFNAKRFYADVIAIDSDDSGYVADRAAQTMKELESQFRKKEHKKRSLGSVPFQIGTDIAFNIGVYCTLRRATKDYPRALDAKTNTPLETVTQWICADTGKILEEHQIKTYFPYGGEKVFFTKEETKVLKDFGEPACKLMGFKPIRTLRFYHNMKGPYFIYPDESSMKGSTVAFHALITEMDRKGVYGVARFANRKAAIPRFVALIPQMEKLDKDGSQKCPPGMHVIFLPYADDIRHPKFEPTPVAEINEIDKAKAMIKSLQAKFDSTTFENPVLQKHYATLQALALDEDPPELEDLTLPDLKKMQGKSKELDAFSEACGLTGGGGGGGGDDDDDDDGANKSRKRKAPSSSSKAKAAPKAKGGKKAKTEKKEDGGGSSVDWAKKVKDGSLKKLTIPELKEYLREHGLPLSGKKDDLLARITDHINGGD